MTARPFLRHSGLDPLPQHLRGAVIAIGNFDGVHRGHQAVLERALEEARRLSAPALVLTFDPHPRQLFQPDRPHFVLTPPPMKAALIEMLGFDGVVEVPFTREFSALTAEEFIQEIMLERLGVAHCLTGVDFHFGRDRQGGPAYLISSGDEHGFGVTLVDSFRDEGADIVSSSRIRTLLEKGETGEANGLLGYRYTVQSEVIHGKKLGRTLGFPTANMALPQSARMAEGIYAVRFRRPDGSLHDGVASFGRRPTVTEDGQPLLETFLMDFNGDLYGETCRVSLFAFQRPELKFDGLEALCEQMNRDKEAAAAILSSARPLGALDGKVAF